MTQQNTLCVSCNRAKFWDATTGYTLYDSLIISAALKIDCDTLYSEALQNGQKIRNLTIIDPFAG